MKKLVAIVGLMVIVFSCATNPFTGKKVLNFVPNSQLFPMAFQQYGTFLKENKVIAGTSDAKTVESVGIKIKNAAERWLKANGQGEYLDGYQWEYKGHFFSWHNWINCCGQGGYYKLPFVFIVWGSI